MIAPPEKPLASFGRRKGRKLRAAKQEAVDTLLPALSVEEWLAPGALPQPLWLEIGFGSGEHLAGQALAHPDVFFIGCEPYVNGFGNLLMQLRGRENPNIRLYTDDARLLLERLPDACLSRVFILFPDPWPKARHHKRRLIQLPFLERLARVMEPGAELMLATDHADYCAWMLEHLLACPHFSWTAESKADWEQPPPGWIRTKYQEWSEKEGRKATWLRFTRN